MQLKRNKKADSSPLMSDLMKTQTIPSHIIPRAHLAASSSSLLLLSISSSLRLWSSLSFSSLTLCRSSRTACCFTCFSLSS